MADHKEIDCPVCEGPLCKLDGTRESVIFEGLEVGVYRGEDGKLIIEITGPDDADLTDKEEPDIRIWLNEALIYAHGTVGDDLSNGGDKTVKEVKRDLA